MRKTDGWECCPGNSPSFSLPLDSANQRSHTSVASDVPGKRQVFELSFHSLRHTAVSLLKDAGIPDAVVMALVGHESAAISQRYTHVGRDALQRAADSLPLL